jgi:hypothetical protein
MNKPIKSKVDITVLITSISQREITIETANYYSEICSEVVLVDEEQPHLSVADISAMKKKGITYVSYTNNNYKNAILEKRKIAASQSNNKYVVHSNHDERYTCHGLIACVTELEKDKNLTFCAGQAIAVRKSESKVYFTRSYENLDGYQNINKVEQRLYYHAKRYAPLAHYAVWRKKSYINVTKETLIIHDLIPSSTMLDEVIFELAADLAGNSKAIPELYWIRNRFNPPSHEFTEKGDQVFMTIEKKLHVLLENLDNAQLTVIMNSLWGSFPFVRSDRFISKSIILIKRMLRTFIKKKVIMVGDIDTFLHDNKIKYDKHDLSNVLKSINL